MIEVQPNTESQPLKVRFESQASDAFTETLKARVDAYFAEKGISKKATLGMVLKSVFYLGGFFAIYFLIILGGFSAFSALVLSMILGLFVAGIGFNISHDALHGSYSSKKWVNELMGHTFSIVGANVYVWNVLHNVVHHSFTNIPEADGDLDSVKALNFYTGRGSKFYHRLQHWYAFPLYCMTSLVWVFKKDYTHMLRKKHLLYDKPPTPKIEVVNLILFKLGYYVAFLLVPMIVTPFAWWQVILGFLAMHAVTGFVLALTFQLGHLIEGTDVPHLAPSGRVPDTWAAHQLKTTANFSSNYPRLATFIFGGLNYQVEHHLFPKICHVHYHKIAPIVESTAREFGLPYHTFGTFSGAVASHLRYLKAVGASS